MAALDDARAEVLRIFDTIECQPALSDLPVDFADRALAAIERLIETKIQLDFADQARAVNLKHYGRVD